MPRYFSKVSRAALLGFFPVFAVSPALALDLNEAKSQGLVGEKHNGLVGEKHNGVKAIKKPGKVGKKKLKAGGKKRQ